MTTLTPADLALEPAPPGRRAAASAGGILRGMSGQPGGEHITLADRELLRHAEHQAVRRPELAWSDTRGAHLLRLDTRATVGAADGVDLCIADPKVSRLHAELEMRPDGLWIRDLGSTNGTYVNGVKVESARVPDAGAIQLGGVTVRVQRADAPSSIELWPVDSFGPLHGQSVAMRALFARLLRIASLESTVLIQGETGTGKEMIARAIHEASPRAGRPMVVVDCAGLPENLLEAELFGHAKGAFTGASSARVGAIESAEGSIVLLDEIGELPLSMQPKLLRAIETRAVRRIGETSYRKVDVRFLSATHRDLRRMVNAGAFREDLYFRLAVVPVLVPPLREHPEDIELLVGHFLAGADHDLITPELMQELVMRPWLGNVRELRNFVERAVALGAVEALAMVDAGEATPAADALRLPAAYLDLPLRSAKDRWLEHLERAYLAGLLDRHQRNVAQVAEQAGVDRSYIHRLIRRYAL